MTKWWKFEKWLQRKRLRLAVLKPDLRSLQNIIWDSSSISEKKYSDSQGRSCVIVIHLGTNDGKGPIREACKDQSYS